MKYIFFVAGLVIFTNAGAQISNGVLLTGPVMALAYSPENFDQSNCNAGYKLPQTNQAWEVWAMKKSWATVTGGCMVTTGFFSTCWGVIKLADTQHEQDALSWIVYGASDMALGYLLYRVGRAHDRNHPYKKGVYRDLRYNYR